MGDTLLYDVATWLPPLVIAIVSHEFAHGLAARHFGDPTAEAAGRLSFNPLRHIDPVGTIALPLILAVAHAPILGWARPVPVDPSKLRRPRRHMVLVALAGPAANFALALLAAVLLGVAGASGAARPVSEALFDFLLVNVFLGLFNLLPLPPFDGGQVLERLLPPRAAAVYARLGRFGFMVVILLLVVLPMAAPEADIVERIVSPPVNAIVATLLGLVGLAV